VNQHGELITSDGGKTSAGRGEEVNITAATTGYSVIQWLVDGKKVTDESGDYLGGVYKFSSLDIGKHYVSLVVGKDGIVYNTNIEITVE